MIGKGETILQRYVLYNTCMCKYVVRATKKNTNILATIFTMEKNAESKFFPFDSVGKRWLL